MKWNSAGGQHCSVDPGSRQQFCDREHSQQLNTVVAICLCVHPVSLSVPLSPSVSPLVSLSPSDVPDGTFNFLYSVTLPKKTCHSASYLLCKPSLRLLFLPGFIFYFFTFAFILVLWNTKLVSNHNRGNDKCSISVFLYSCWLYLACHTPTWHP